jgi:KipI family sensor histidine kinase inhibitor
MQGRPIDQRRSAAGPKKAALMLECKSPKGGSPNYRVLPAGDTAVVIEFGDAVDRKLSAWVLALAHRLNEQDVDGVIETVPTFRSLLVYYDPVVLPVASLIAQIDRMIAGVHGCEGSGRSVRLPVCYDTSVAPDLHEVARRTGLSPAQVIERHSAVTYHVYMLGFLPGQAYMGDLAFELSLPRRESPRSKIPAGSLAIAARMTCIFPFDTPCGWHVIGRSPVALWKRKPQPCAILAPGDKVTFAPVSLREYGDLLAKEANGELWNASETEMGAAA